ncbi:porin [Marinobacterium arenosum]|uniref:porin n=1 Tax=Marinobacterium arenosum TaxID=2862496 RepID=UPI001C948F8D|nr:porin [Marinobacterium arenosum]MBY4679143.1 porin [Marinobacterium arenosum]
MKMQRNLLAVAVSATLAFASTARAGVDEIEMLRAQIEALNKRLDQLEKQTLQAEQKAAAAEAKVQMVSNSAGSMERVVTSGNNKVRVSVSGQVNRALLWADDGESSNVYHVDNDASSTRMRVIGEADVSDEMTVGAALEVQFESNSTANVNQLDDTGVGDDHFTQRRLEVYFDHKRYGKLWLGQGWTASEDTSEVDLSGTDLAGYSSTADMAGGILFRDAGGALTGTAVGDVFANFDGRGRADRLRYDTPSFGGFSVAVSAIEGDAWDTALRYSGKFGAAKVAGALAYSEPDSSTVDGQVNGSVSILFDNGVNLTLAAGERDLASGSEDPSFYYGKLGYQTRLNSAGMTSFSIDYHSSDDVALVGDEATSYGLQAVQKIDAWATEGYVGWRTYELDRTGGDLQDVDALIAGARVKF